MEAGGASTDNEATFFKPPLVRVFGGVQVDDLGEPISIGGPRQRRLLALLVVRPGRLADNDWLTENLWPDANRPEVGAPAIRTAISRLRMALPVSARSWISTEPAGYRWVGPPETIEHRWFEAHRARASILAEDGDAQTAFDLLTEALACWRGEPFRELEELDWAMPDIEQLRMDRLEVMEDRWELALALDRHSDIIGELAAFTTEHGLRDRAVRQHALALHRSGRSAEALRVLDRHRRLLADESGLDPSAEVTELERAILDGQVPLGPGPALRRLRGYRLLEEAGSGAFAVVWRGYQPSVNREVAIKQIRAELASQPDFIRRFEAEAQLVARLEHPHIVPLIDFWREPDSAYLVMRWLPGGTLEDLLSARALSVAEARRVVDQVGGALAAAHAAGVAHCDITADNILFDNSGNAYLTDFGIAAEASSGRSAADDVASLALVFIECLTGSQAGDADPDNSAEDTSADATFTLLDGRTDVPGSTVAAIERAVSTTPGHGYDSVVEFLAALTGAEPGAGPTGKPSNGVATVPNVENPYRGLLAFTDADASNFYGRDALVAELVDRLAPGTAAEGGGAAVIVVGPSGSGKSSVVRAGLLPALRDGALSGSSDWFITIMAPGTRPFEALEAALLRVAVNPPASLLDQLGHGPRGLLRGVRRCLAADDDVLVLVVDQFEELFTGASDDDAERFLHGLAVAATEPDSPVRLVATLRADYYDRPLSHAAFAPVLKHGAVDLTPLTAEELERAIVGPAEGHGIRFESGLVARMVADTVGQPAPLPLLQYALSELFDRRDGTSIRTAAYDQIGGLGGALTVRAETIYQEATANEQETIRRVFGHLIDPAATAADLRRRIGVPDLGDDPAVGHVLDRFGAARLLTFDRDPASREQTVEVAHEALLREWPRLVDWIREDRTLLRAVADVARAANTWDDGGRQPADLYRAGRLAAAMELAEQSGDRLRPLDRAFVGASFREAEAERRTEAGRLRRRRALVASVASALVVASVAGVLAFGQRNQARESANEAEIATLLADSLAARDELPEVGLRLAMAAYDREATAETETALREALLNSSVATRSAAPLDPLEDDCGFSTIAGEYEYAVIDGTMISRHLRDGFQLAHGPSPAPCVQWFGDWERQRRVALSQDDGRAWFGQLNGGWDNEQDYGVQHFCWSCRLTETGRLLLVESGERGNTALIVDDQTGEPIGPAYPDRGSVNWAGVSGDGSMIAMTVVASDPDMTVFTTKVIDSDSGQELWSVDDLSGTSFFFDRGRDELLVLDDGVLHTLRLDDGELMATVATGVDGGQSIPRIIGMRPDGTLLVAARNTISIIDRDRGPVGRPIGLPPGSFALEQWADGTIRASRRGGSVELYDPTTNALIDRTIPLNRSAAVGLGPSTAVVVGYPERPVLTMAELEEVVAEEIPPAELSLLDLENGQPVTAGGLDLDLGFPTLVAPVKQQPGPEGQREDQDVVIATGPERMDDATGRHVIRWRGGEVVDQLDLPTPFNGPASSPVPKPRYDFAAQQLLFPVQTGSGTVAALVIAVGDPSAGQDPLEIVSTTEFPIDELAAVFPGRDGGYFAYLRNEIRFYNRFGSETGAFDLASGIPPALPAWAVGSAAVWDATSDRLALPSGDGIVVLDDDGSQVSRIPQPEQVVDLAFARNGGLLVVRQADDSIRLWNINEATPGGVIWGGGNELAQDSRMVYDPTEQALWFTTGQRILRAPLGVEALFDRACQLIGTEATPSGTSAGSNGDGFDHSICD